MKEDFLPVFESVEAKRQELARAALPKDAAMLQRSIFQQFWRRGMGGMGMGMGSGLFCFFAFGMDANQDESELVKDECGFQGSKHRK